MFAPPLIVLALLLTPFLRAAEPAATQVIELNDGWNLISLQVSSGLTPAQFQTALGPVDSSKLRAIWSFGDPSIAGSAPWQWKVWRKDPLEPRDLTLLQPGKGYWVKVAGYCQATLEGTPWNGTITVRPGWNLVGFPGVSLAANEQQELAALLGPHFGSITQVWAWDSSSAQRFTGYDITSIPQMKDLTAAQPGRGYWVYSIASSNITLAPEPYLALPADGDASPPQPAEAFSAADPRWLGTDAAKYVGETVRFRRNATEGDLRSDVPFDLNANGILDDPYTQDTILFEQATDAVPVTIGNRGTGAITWTLENAVPWLFTAPPDEKEWPANAGRPRTAAGTVSGETDTLILYVDRRGLSSGRKGPAAVTVWAGGVAHPLKILLDVPAVKGDWRGYAATTRVGGKDISLGEVRLAMNIFPDPADPLRFKAVLDREKAILFPRDVYMDGLFFSADETDFKLTTNFAMPAGDRNAPPYNTFQHTTADSFPPGDANAIKKAARGDKDWNGDGKVDAMNPFPFGVRREVTLLGRRVAPGRLEGTYIESIRGLLPPAQGSDLLSDLNRFTGESLLTTSQPVFIEGTFVLERQSFEPSKRSVVNETRNPELTIGGAGDTFRSTPISVLTPFTVQSVVVRLDMEFPDPGLLRITLVSPQGTVHTLHEFGDELPESVAIPASVFAGEPGNGEWRLEVEWDGTTGERGILHSWGLEIEGVSTHSVTGRIVQAGTTTPLTGVTVRLEGSLVPLYFTTGADGTFTFDGLTENDYTLFLSKPGYQPATTTFFLGEADIAVAETETDLTPLAVTEATKRIEAAPVWGFEELHVDLQVLVPAAYNDSTVSWNFGDGTPALAGALSGQATVDGETVALVAPFHRFRAPGVFTPQVTLSGGGLGSPVTITGPAIYVQRRRPDAAGTASTIQAISSGVPSASLAARTDATAAAVNAAAFSHTEAQTTFTDAAGTVNIASAVVFQESKWDPASFDIDRWPLMTEAGFTDFNPAGEDTDFQIGSLSPAYVYYNAATSQYRTRAWRTPAAPGLPTPNDPLYDSTSGYSVHPMPPAPDAPPRPIRFRMAVSLGGTVLAPQPMSSGGITLHPGRTLQP